jgi:alpha-glucosidase
VVVSLSAKKEHLTLPEELTPVLTAGSINLQGKELTLMPFAGVVLQKKK